MEKKMKKYQFSDFTKEMIPQALQLLKGAYEAEQSFNQCLPQFGKLPDSDGLLTHLAENGMGVAATLDGNLVGFLGAYLPFPHAYNSPTDSGCWSPLNAHAVADPQSIILWQQLYQKAAAKWTTAGAGYHSITFYRHEGAAENVFYNYGFGSRCADAIRYTDSLQEMPAASASVRELTKKDDMQLRQLRRELAAHLSKSPCFMINSEESIEKYIRGKEADEKRKTFGLFYEGRLVGFIDLNEEGENFISDSEVMLNIQGMFLQKDYRGHGFAQLLLNSAIRETVERGYERIGVDYETMNPTATGFWEKYFMPYTRSLVRRLD